MTSATPDTTDRPSAELDRRFYAFTIDRLTVWTAYAVAGWASYVVLIADGHEPAGVAVIVGVVVAIGLVMSLVLGRSGTSPGKAAVGLRVVDDSTGAPIGFGRALQRTVVLGIATLPTFGLGVATLAWTAVTDPDRHRRGAHDRWVRSVVVDVRPAVVDEHPVPEQPRQIVNLTAMRLVPTSDARPREIPTRLQRSRWDTGPATPPVPDGPRPLPPTAAPAWAVSFDTGQMFAVDGFTLVGRKPEARPGEPVKRLVALPSQDMSLSKTHAQFQVVPDGALVVMDRGSTNGSILIRGGVPRELRPGRPATLRDGDRVRFGDREMRVVRRS